MTFTEFIETHFGTWVQLGRVLNVSEVTCHRWRKNPGMIKAKYIGRIADYTGRTPEEIIRTINTQINGSNT